MKLNKTILEYQAPALSELDIELARGDKDWTGIASNDDIIEFANRDECEENSTFSLDD